MSMQLSKEGSYAAAAIPTIITVPVIVTIPVGSYRCSKKKSLAEKAAIATQPALPYSQRSCRGCSFMNDQSFVYRHLFMNRQANSFYLIGLEVSWLVSTVALSSTVVL